MGISNSNWVDNFLLWSYLRVADVSSISIRGRIRAMSDLNRGIMKFDGADSPKAIVISAVLVLGSIGVLILWALQSAYALG